MKKFIARTDTSILNKKLKTTTTKKHHWFIVENGVARLIGDK